MQLVTVITLALLALPLRLAAQGANESADCRDLRVIVRLARIGGLARDRLTSIEEQRGISCATPTMPKTLRWLKGGLARDEQRRWTYPFSSVRAKSPDGELRYHGGIRAKDPRTERWLYPNNATAKERDPKTADGRWLRPGGAKTFTETEIIRWACNRVQKSVCDEKLRDLGSTSDDEHVLALIEFVWIAHGTKP